VWGRCRAPLRGCGLASVGAQRCPRLYSASGRPYEQWSLVWGHSGAPVCIVRVGVLWDARARWAKFVYTGALSDALTRWVCGGWGTAVWCERTLLRAVVFGVVAQRYSASGRPYEAVVLRVWGHSSTPVCIVPLSIVPLSI
jgi:hypothetical protein